MQDQIDDKHFHVQAFYNNQLVGEILTQKAEEAAKLYAFYAKNEYNKYTVSFVVLTNEQANSVREKATNDVKKIDMA